MTPDALAVERDWLLEHGRSLEEVMAMQRGADGKMEAATRTLRDETVRRDRYPGWQSRGLHPCLDCRRAEGHNSGCRVTLAVDAIDRALGFLVAEPPAANRTRDDGASEDEEFPFGRPSQADEESQ